MSSPGLSARPALLFDLDGTLVDSVYQHVLEGLVGRLDQIRPLPGARELLAAQRAGALGVGLLSGGYGREELEGAGAYRVFEDPADLLAHLDELGIRAAS